MDFSAYSATYRSGGATGVLPRSNPSGTPNEESIVGWLRSPDARNYEGQWVLFRLPNIVLDSDLSPSALKSRHADEESPLIAYVQSHGGSFVG